jgi:hypothetical protein
MTPCRSMPPTHPPARPPHPRTASRKSCRAPRARSRGSTNITLSGWSASRCKHPFPPARAVGASAGSEEGEEEEEAVVVVSVSWLSSSTARVTPVCVCMCAVVGDTESVRARDPRRQSPSHSFTCTSKRAPKQQRPGT